MDISIVYVIYSGFTVGFLHLIWHKEISKCTYIFAQTLLVTEDWRNQPTWIWATFRSSKLYPQTWSSDALPHRLHDFGDILWNFIVSFSNSWVAKCGKGPGSLRYLGFRTTGRHAGCKRSVPTSIASQGKTAGSGNLGKSVTEHVTLVAIRHLAVAWQSNLKRHWRGGSHQQTWQLVCTFQEMSAAKVIADYQSAGPKMKEDRLSWMYAKFFASKSQNVLGFMWCSSWKPTDMGLPGVQYLRKNMDSQLSLISIIPIETGILLHPVFRQTHILLNRGYYSAQHRLGLGLQVLLRWLLHHPWRWCCWDCVQAPQIPTESHDILGHTREYGNYNIHIYIIIYIYIYNYIYTSIYAFDSVEVHL